MQLDYLSEFLDLASTLSFTRSAENLHMTQPTLSRHIAELERHVGTSLFVRSTNYVKLTRSGKALYEKAVSMVRDYDDLTQSLKDISKIPITPVKVGGSTVQPTVNRIFTKLAAQAIARELPIRFEYARTRSFAGESPSINASDMLESGDADIIIEPLNSNSPHLITKETIYICDEELIVFASPENPLAKRENLKLEDLRGSTLVTLAVYRHCPALMQEPFLDAGFSHDHTKTYFIGNLLEIPEHLVSLEDDQIVALQKGFCESFGFGSEGLGRTVRLDLRDDRSKIAFWALYRKNEENQAVIDAVSLLKEIIDSYHSKALPSDFNETGGMWSSVFGSLGACR